MMTAAQRRALEAQAAEQLRQSWGDVKPNAIAEAIADIRARVVEEPWFGRSFELGDELREIANAHEVYGRDVVAEHDRTAEADMPAARDEAAER